MLMSVDIEQVLRGATGAQQASYHIGRKGRIISLRATKVHSNKSSSNSRISITIVPIRKTTSPRDMAMRFQTAAVKR